MQLDEILNSFSRELERAEKLHPEWPNDLIHQVAIMVEESGETMKASLDFTYHNMPFRDIIKEAIHTGAMCIRLLKNLEPPCQT